ncbi:hypothetical protein [Streptacidiphilus cavernicola]|uniref:Integral membrane protein n=1 Tax=Streptacidiphilus cavernicola TaxID=3342716 RepID=A0ABV6VPF3_9ACTN
MEQLAADSGRVTLLVMLLSFIATFGVTRLVVRLIRSGRGPFGDVQVDGVHVHHLVPGIFIMLASAPLEFVLAPHGAARNALAGVFSAGAALTLDEFALWLHLTDVYWEQEGRQSVDAVVGVAGLGTVGLVAANPLSRQQGEGIWFFVGVLLLHAATSLVAALKGRYWFALAGILVPFASLVVALRLARPGSWWFRRFYPAGQRKEQAASRRAARPGLTGRAEGAIGGFPPRDEP